MPEPEKEAVEQNDRRLFNREAAHFLGMAPSTLSQKRFYGAGPPYLKYGGKVVYLASDLREYMQSHRIVPNGDDAKQRAEHRAEQRAMLPRRGRGRPRKVVSKK
jgi:hypothetical protein